MAGNKNSGRPRKPNALRILDGTYREDRHGPKEDFATGVPVRPKRMTKEAGWFWDTHVKPLIDKGVAKELDTAMLIDLCWWHEQKKKWKEAFDKTPTQDAKANLDMCARNFNSIASRFGLTAADRAKLDVGTSDKPKGIAARVRA